MGHHDKRHYTCRRSARFLTALLAPALILSLPVAQAQEKPDVVRSGIQLTTSADISVKQRGWGKAALGVPVEWTTFNSGKDAVLGLGAGGVDWSLTGSAPAAFGLSSGVEGEVIWIFHLLGPGEALMVQPDSGYESLEDLKGKNIAAPFGTTTHFDLLKAIDEAGMSQSDFNILDMSPQDMAAAFERGDIAAGWVWYPALARLYDAGGVSILDASDMAEKGYPTADLLTVNPSFAEQYPDTVARYIGALNCATVMAKKDIQYMVNDINAEFGLDKKAAKQALEALKRLTAEEQLSEQWMGTGEEPGGMANSIYQQATFLAEQDITDNAYDKEYYQKRVNPEYIQMAIDKGYTENCSELPDWPE